MNKAGRDLHASQCTNRRGRRDSVAKAIGQKVKAQSLNGSGRKEKVRKKHEGERETAEATPNPPGIQPQELTRGCVSNSVVILLQGNAIRVSPQSISSGGSNSSCLLRCG